MGCALVPIALLCGSPPAAANGRFPRADQLVAVPGQPEKLALRTTFGLLLSNDAGSTWDWLCEQAIGFEGQEDPALAALADGSVLAGLSTGLARSADRGCSWRFAELPGQPVQLVDLSVRPLAPLSAVALAWESVPGANAFDYASRFFSTTDGGASWTPYGIGIDPSVLVLTLDVAASDPRRLYASGIRPADRTAALFVSMDEGETWSERPVPFQTPREQGLYIAAVDPMDPDRVYMRTSGAAYGRLFVTLDAGASSEEVFSARSLLGFALSPDGADIFVGGLDNGLWAARRGEHAFEQRATLPIQCLMTAADLLYACSNELTGFALGVSTDGGREFTAKLHLSEVRGPLSCPADTSANTCLAQWLRVADAIGISPEPLPVPDGSTPEPSPAPDGSQAGVRMPRAGGSGCSMAAAPGRVGSASALSFIACLIAFSALVGRLPWPKARSEERRLDAGARTGSLTGAPHLSRSELV